MENVYQIAVYKARTNTANYDQLKTYMVTGNSMRDIKAMLSDLYRGKGKQFDIYRVVHPGKVGVKNGKAD